MELSESLISKLHRSFCNGLPFAFPSSLLRTDELDLVRGILQILQGFSSSLFYWDHSGHCFRIQSGIYVSHLSKTGLYGFLDQFMFAATCLKLVEFSVNRVEKYGGSPSPTLRAFACSVSSCLRRLRDVALREEEKINNPGGRAIPTLLGLSNSLTSLCSGAEYLLQIVHDVVPESFSEPDYSASAADAAVHILDQLYRKLNEACLVEGGEEEAHMMLLYIFVGSIFPFIEGLDSWLFEGMLDDPFEEMFFYANKAIAIDENEFWEKSYLLRTRTFPKSQQDSTTDALLHVKEKKNILGKETVSSYSTKEKEGKGRDIVACPLFLKEVAKAIVSAGKSLQLIRHAPKMPSSAVSIDKHGIGHQISGLTLLEVFCVSLAALVGYSDHISEYLWLDDLMVCPFKYPLETLNGEEKSGFLQAIPCSDKMWYNFLVDAVLQKKMIGLDLVPRDIAGLDTPGKKLLADRTNESRHAGAYFPQNPTMTVCRRFFADDEAQSKLNISRSLRLPSLNDEELRKAVFGSSKDNNFGPKSTDFAFGFQFDESELLRQDEETEVLEMLFPYPTLLPSFEEEACVSDCLPFQKNSTLPSRILSWIQPLKPRGTLVPVVILQECLITYIKKQADYIGGNILSMLLNDWKLLDELGVLRAIYLLGSGDLLHHFLAVIFSKLDKGESLDDEFELNTILQESVRNSSDGVLLNPDSLVVSITKSPGFREAEGHTSSVYSSITKNRQTSGINALESLQFTYRVSWPLELIANAEAMKKYNQVMVFLLKVKRAKFVLDEVRKWMLKDRGTTRTASKRHWLLEQKLLNFVDAFHQYVMDRVYHSAWRELCDGVAAAGSLDEVIEVHESYLLSIQRQCFVVPEKLWALIASRLNSILGLALEFYSIQQTLFSGPTSAIKARCKLEVDRIERQFDECVAFLLKILSLKLNVGQFPHLADLVTRINYNYFYVSESGNLKTTTSGTDTIASKPGKDFQKQ